MMMFFDIFYYESFKKEIIDQDIQISGILDQQKDLTIKAINTCEMINDTIDNEEFMIQQLKEMNQTLQD